MDIVHVAILSMHFNWRMRPFGYIVQRITKIMEVRASHFCLGKCQRFMRCLRRDIEVKKTKKKMKILQNLFPPSRSMMTIWMWGFSCVDSLARWLVSLSVLEHFCDVDYFLLSLEVSSLIADVSGCNFQSQDCLFLSLKNFH